MSTPPITALIADDESLMRSRLKKLLAQAWPSLSIVASAESGTVAAEQIALLRPNIAFLDIQMPGMTGLEVAATITAPTHVVFVTAYDQYALTAFDRGAIDYILKPAELPRVIDTVSRLKARLSAPPADMTAVLASLLNQSASSRANPTRSNWIRASLGATTKLININDVLFFQSDAKYTRIVLRDSEALVRTPLKELVDDLDPEQFWQVHRGTIVNVSAIDKAVREGPEQLVIHLKVCAEKIRVSRQYFYLFKQA